MQIKNMQYVNKIIVIQYLEEIILQKKALVLNINNVNGNLEIPLESDENCSKVIKVC